MLLLLLLVFFRLDRDSRSSLGVPVSISTSKFHFVPRASTVSRQLRCCPGRFLRTDLHLGKPCFAPTKCSSDEASRHHQQPLIHLFVSLIARTSWSGINANTDSPNFHNNETYGVPSKYWNGVLPSGRTVNLREQIQRNELQMDWQVKIAESCVLVFVLICV